MCIKAVVGKLLHLGESWRCRKGPERLLHVGQFCDRDFLSCDRASDSVSQHGSLFRDMVLKLQVGCWVATRVPTVSQQGSPQCHNNVETKVLLSRSRQSRQEVRVATELS